MKLGVISDIHADLRAFRQTYRRLRQEYAVDAIWCAGDLVGRGQWPNEVVSAIMDYEIPTVMGNHDEMMLLPSPYSKNPTISLGEMLGCKPRTLRLLRTLPRTYRAQLNGVTVVMVHGTPRSNIEGIGIHPRKRQEALNWLYRSGADILIVGHTHVPLHIQSEHRLVVNPGSLFKPVGTSRSSSETFGVLDVEARQFNVYPVWA